MTVSSREAVDPKIAALRAASDEARAAVAASPDDEAAAEALFLAVERAQREVPPAKVDLPAIAPTVLEAARLLTAGEDEAAEQLLRRHLTVARNDPYAMRLMADIAMQCGFPDNAEKILRRLVEVHPNLQSGWVALGQLLSTSQDPAQIEEALACYERAMDSEAADPAPLGLKATLLVEARRLEEAEQVLQRQLRLAPENAHAWLSFAYLLKTFGRFGQAVAAYRTAAALDPSDGATWWTLADLKRARLFNFDIQRMEAALATAADELARVNLHFALAVAYDQAKDFERAAGHLRDGNALRLKLRPYDIAAVHREVGAAIETYTPDFFFRHRGGGEQSAAPIFVLGMPRSGSTLVEQILASHSQVEGTKELFALGQVASAIMRRSELQPVEAALAQLPSSELRNFGAHYLELAKVDRHTDRPRFTDKNPDNWRLAGLIHLILPNAKIVDIRRNPIDCCFANYTQHFLAGADYSYGFEELAARYRDYVRLMRHLDEAAPGVMHRVIYEDLVEDLEQEVRLLLNYLELPFEDSCLRFFETERAVHTPSAGQVRQPINRAGLGKWKSYEPWIGGLKDALGDLLTDWRR